MEQIRLHFAIRRAHLTAVACRCFRWWWRILCYSWWRGRLLIVFLVFIAGGCVFARLATTEHQCALTLWLTVHRTAFLRRTIGSGIFLSCIFMSCIFVSYIFSAPSTTYICCMILQKWMQVTSGIDSFQLWRYSSILSPCVWLMMESSVFRCCADM